MATHMLRLAQGALGSSSAWVPSPPRSSALRRPLCLTTGGLDRSACAARSAPTAAPSSSPSSSAPCSTQPLDPLRRASHRPPDDDGDHARSTRCCDSWIIDCRSSSKYRASISSSSPARRPPPRDRSNRLRGCSRAPPASTPPPLPGPPSPARSSGSPPRSCSVGLPIASARAHAASSRSSPYFSPIRISPRHARRPDSGCGPRSRIAAATSPVFGPFVRAQPTSRSGGHSPHSRCDSRPVLRLRHRRPLRPVAALVRRDALAVAPHLDHRRRRAHVDLGVDQLAGHAVVAGRRTSTW